MDYPPSTPSPPSSIRRRATPAIVFSLTSSPAIFVRRDAQPSAESARKPDAPARHHTRERPVMFIPFSPQTFCSRVVRKTAIRTLRSRRSRQRYAARQPAKMMSQLNDYRRRHAVTVEGLAFHAQSLTSGHYTTHLLPHRLCQNDEARCFLDSPYAVDVHWRCADAPNAAFIPPARRRQMA